MFKRSGDGGLYPLNLFASCGRVNVLDIDKIPGHSLISVNPLAQAGIVSYIMREPLTYHNAFEEIPATISQLVGFSPCAIADEISCCYGVLIIANGCFCCSL